MLFSNAVIPGLPAWTYTGFRHPWLRQRYHRAKPVAVRNINIAALSPTLSGLLALLK